MIELTRRRLLATAGTAAATLAVGFPVQSEDRTSVRIGYIVSKTGVNAPGAGTTTSPNYELWATDVKAAGGIAMPDGRRLPLEIIAYDDRSQTEEAVRGIERLARQDKVDFILSPWGTGFNLAVAPLMDRFGYPHLVGTSMIPSEIDVRNKWKRSFWFLGTADEYTETLATTFSGPGQDLTNRKVAMISVADGFGIELAGPARKKFADAGLEIAMDKSYPIGTQDFATLLNEAASSGADIFVALSYPPDTFAMTKQARLMGYNPKVFYTGVGTSFSIFSDINEGKVEGVMSLGGIDESRAEMKAYVERHKKVLGAPPDYWASSLIYTSLQMLQQAIGRRGLDRDAVAEELGTGEFDTIIGKVKLNENRLNDLWLLGQWQGDTFVGVAPADRAGAKPLMIPKPAWS